MAKRKQTDTPAARTEVLNDIERNAEARTKGLVASQILDVEQDERLEPGSAQDGTGNGRVVMSVDPGAVEIDPRIHALRQWSGTSAQELAIPELARLIVEEGQQQACLVRLNAAGDMVLVFGHRRKAAVEYAREQGWRVERVGPDGTVEEMDLMLDVVIDPNMDEVRALRAAMAENVQRQDFTKMELAHNIQYIRQVFEWEGKEGTADVAGFLGVSPATITETEKLLTLPAEVQADVQAGRLSGAAALELAQVQADSLPAVLEKAQAKADAEAEKRAENERKRQRIAQERVSGKQKPSKEATAGGKKAQDETETQEVSGDAYASGGESPATAAVPAPVKGKVTGKHIRQAIDQVPGAGRKTLTGERKAPKMGELCDLMDSYNSPAAYPPVLCKLAETLAAWGHGKAATKKVETAWEDLADAVHGGRSKARSAAEVKAQEKSPAKKVAKPAGTEKKNGGKAKVKKTAAAATPATKKGTGKGGRK